MKKTLLLFGLLFFSIGAKAAHAQEPAAPTATPATGAIIPTVTALSITLHGPTGADILYKLNDAAEVLYAGPISLTATSTIEARSRVEIIDLIPLYQYSEVETFTYTKNTLPTVSITMPLDGAEFTLGTAIELRAPANSGNTGDAITAVRYYNGATLLGSGNTGANRMFSWVGAPVGTHSITAVAVDSYGGSTTSDAISITVAAPPNAAPTANAGANATTTVGATAIALNGSGSSDPEDGVLTFSWAGPAGAGFTLTGAATATPSVSFTAAGSYIFTLTVEDEGGLKDTDEMTVTVGVKPAITSVLTATGTVGLPFSYTITATGTAPITYSTSSLAGTGLTLTGAVISGTPTTAGPKAVTLTATNTYGTDSKSLAITISNAANEPPIANAGANATTTVGAPAIELDGTGSSDPEDTDLTFAWTGPAGVGYTLTGAATATPGVSFTAAGSYTFTLTVTDEGSPAESATDQVVVQVGIKPTITSALTASGTVGSPFSYTITATGTAPITYSTSSLTGTGLTLTGAVLSGTPTTAGPKAVTITATNTPYGADSKTLTITISAANAAPTVTISAPANGASFVSPNSPTITATATDADGTVASVEFFRNGVSIGVDATPASFSLATALGVGSHILTARATDNDDFTGPVSAAVNITITGPANSAPTVTISAPANGASFVSPNSPTITATATDADGTVASVEFFRNGVSIGVDATPASFSLATALGVGSHILTARATDNDDLTGPVSAAVNITITGPANSAPTARAGNDTVVVLTANSVSGSLNGSASTDPEDGALEYLWTVPTGVAIVGSGATSPTPTLQFSSTGSHRIILKVTDTGNLTDSDTLFVTVRSLPVITSALSASGNANTAFSYVMTATGFPAPTLTVGTLPTWLAWNAGTRTLSGTPTATGATSVTMTATNAAGTASEVLKITISVGVTKPTINSGLTASIKAGTAFSYAVTASGTAPITFTTGALPAWLAFASPNLTGTPSLTQTGTFSIALTASNTQGIDNKTLTINVTSDPKITKDLETLYTVNEKSLLTMSVNATGYPAVTYQWQYGTTSTNLTNSGISTSNQYSINQTPLSAAGYYRVIVKNGAGPDVSSKIAQVVVVALPAPIRIVAGSGPTAQTVIQGERVVFKTKATGAGPLSYQWFKGSTSVTVAKANDTLFTIASAQTGDAAVYRARVTNSYTVDTDASTYAWSDTARLNVLLPKLEKPTANPPGGTFTTKNVDVTLSNVVAGTSIYYTLDNSDPTETASARNFLYTAGTPVRVVATAILKAKAFKTGYRASDAMTGTYSYTEPGKVAKPTIRPPAPTFKTTRICTLFTTTEGASIYYTTDLSNPAQSGKLFDKSLTVDTTTTIIAIARKSGMTDSDTLRMTYTLEAPTPTVLSPRADPPSKIFTGQLSIALSTPTDSAAIHYTLDGSEPDSLKPKFVPNAPIKITATTTLKFFAVRKGSIPSPVVTETYNLIPGPITATPPPSYFENSIIVTLSAVPAKAVIHYSLDGAVTTESDVFPSAGLLISDVTTINAIAVADGVSSLVTSFGYTKIGGAMTTPSPRTASNSTTFKDTVRVFLSSGPGADIYYTLNGDLPDDLSQKYTAEGILLDTTTTIQAFAKHPAFKDSRNMIATYTLVPDKPTASPPGGYYSNTVFVKLHSSSRRAEIIYTLDGSDPGPHTQLSYRKGDSIRIAATTILKYTAVAGNMSSPVAEENYNIFEEEVFTLLPGTNVFLKGGYTMRNPEGQSAIVIVRLSSADSLRLKGFDGIQYSITTSLAKESSIAGVEFPDLMFNSPVSEVRSVYKLDPTGKVYFLSSADTMTFSQAGIYFLGLDISPPTIKYLSESFDAKDSTEVVFHIEDNVANLAYDLRRSDNPLFNVSQRGLLSPRDLSIKLKNPSGVVKPLTVQLFVTDYQTATFYPTDSRSTLRLSQRFAPFKGPASWKIGTFTKSPYDLVGIPLNLSQPLTLESLRKANVGVTIEGAAWNNSKKIYVPLNEKESMNPGQGYWLASRSPINSLSLPSATILPGGTEKFTVRLRNGWNQIANPHLEDLYWPFTRILGTDYDSSKIKILHEYNPGLPIPNFEESDVLKPWRGYFAYNHGEDVTVELSSKPTVVVSLKKSSAQGSRYAMSLGWGATRSLRLGADWVSRDGLGVEDEYVLPRRGDAPFMRAVREGSALLSDLVRMNRDGILHWTVALDGSGDSLATLSILSQESPEGYETWAASRSRSMKIKIEAGTRINASGLVRDTMEFYAGPADKLASFDALRKLSELPPALDLRVSARNGGFTMHMSLPQRAKIRATVWGLDGKKKANLALGPLSEGIYRFEYESDFHGQGRRLTPGMYFLSVEIVGTGLSRRLTKKLVLAN